ncbi:hypothetical protein QBC41DRAFT_327421 [Cercophora samala]|uniref:Uncharacterized protein n=1 Tax=Cercophora samala TaxID=330535 RepID=A0AA39Z8V4_9PEZI|nr:hypothetical protein QBC41DRAFT_327421 [Cercophora samala]
MVVVVAMMMIKRRRRWWCCYWGWRHSWAGVVGIRGGRGRTGWWSHRRWSRPTKKMIPRTRTHCRFPRAFFGRRTRHDAGGYLERYS